MKNLFGWETDKQQAFKDENPEPVRESKPWHVMAVLVVAAIAISTIAISSNNENETNVTIAGEP